MKGVNNNNKIFAALAVLVIVALGWYFFVREKPSDMAGESFIVDDPMLASAQGAGDIGIEIIKLLSKIQGLTIDTQMFKDPAYRSLVDYTQDVAPQKVGRDNPFAPIPGLPTTRSATDPRLGPVSR